MCDAFPLVCVENKIKIYKRYLPPYILFLGVFAKLQKATISSVMSVCPSVRMEPFGFQLGGFNGN